MLNLTNFTVSGAHLWFLEAISPKNSCNSGLSKIRTFTRVWDLYNSPIVRFCRLSSISIRGLLRLFIQGSLNFFNFPKKMRFSWISSIKKIKKKISRKLEIHGWIRCEKSFQKMYTYAIKK